MGGWIDGWTVGRMVGWVMICLGRRLEAANAVSAPFLPLPPSLLHKCKSSKSTGGGRSHQPHHVTGGQAEAAVRSLRVVNRYEGDWW